MKTLSVIFIFTIITMTFPVQATQQHTHMQNHNHKGMETNQPETSVMENMSCETMINVRVKGLVCDFCARSIEKVFGKQKAVKSVKVDLGKRLVSIELHQKETIDNATITKLINDSGYSVKNITKGCVDE